MNVVHNDFRQSHGIFPLFDNLEVKDMDKNVEPLSSVVNGSAEEHGPNGVNGAKVVVNGDHGGAHKSVTN